MYLIRLTLSQLKYWRVGAVKVAKEWEGGREKQASKLAKQTPAKAHGNAPADLPGPPT